MERWLRIGKDLDKIKAHGDFCLIVGDFNNHAGCDKLGVEGNTEKITYGGQLV